MMESAEWDFATRGMDATNPGSWFSDEMAEHSNQLRVEIKQRYLEDYVSGKHVKLENDDFTKRAEHILFHTSTQERMASIDGSYIEWIEALQEFTRLEREVSAAHIKLAEMSDRLFYSGERE